MRILFVTIIVFVFYNSYILGQKHTVGVQGGLNYSSLYTQPSRVSSFKMHYKLGFNFSFSYEYCISEKVAFGTGLGFNNYGFASEIYSDNKKYESKEVYNFLTLPIKVKFKTLGKIYAFAGIGLMPGFLLRNEGESYENGKLQHKYESTEKFTRIDLFGSIDAGVGFMLTEKLSIDLSLAFNHSIVGLTLINSQVSRSRLFSFVTNLGIKYRF